MNESLMDPKLIVRVGLKPQVCFRSNRPRHTPGATFDSDHAQKPPFAEPSSTDQELNPGEHVEGLGDFGKPTGKFGTVEQANEGDFDDRAIFVSLLIGSGI